MGDLQKEKLMSEEPPFTHVRVDYFGPLYVRHRRPNVRRYGCLFTCLAVELCRDLGSSLGWACSHERLRVFSCSFFFQVLRCVKLV